MVFGGKRQLTSLCKLHCVVRKRDHIRFRCVICDGKIGVCKKLNFWEGKWGQSQMTVLDFVCVLVV